jgi:hypothetical protein
MAGHRDHAPAVEQHEKPVNLEPDNVQFRKQPDRLKLKSQAKGYFIASAA